MENITNLDSHYANNPKTQRKKNIIATPPVSIPMHQLFSNKKAQQKIDTINFDIYKNTQKEKSKNEFSKPLFLKILGGVTLGTFCILGWNKIRNFFR